LTKFLSDRGPEDDDDQEDLEDDDDDQEDLEDEDDDSEDLEDVEDDGEEIVDGEFANPEPGSVWEADDGNRYILGDNNMWRPFDDEEDDDDPDEIEE